MILVPINLVVSGRFVVTGDAAATARNIQASELTYFSSREQRNQHSSDPAPALRRAQDHVLPTIPPPNRQEKARQVIVTPASDIEPVGVSRTSRTRRA